MNTRTVSQTGTMNRTTTYPSRDGKDRRARVGRRAGVGSKYLMVALFLVGPAGAGLAGPASARSGVNGGAEPRISRTEGNDVLLLETTSTAIGQALNDDGVPWDWCGTPWPLHFPHYRDIFVGMDDGYVDTTAVQALAAWAADGGHLHFFGGTCQPDYAAAMNRYLVHNDLSNFCWSPVSGRPEMTVTDPSSYLAYGLPSAHDWGNDDASGYQIHVIDPRIWEAARNGDGYPMLFSRAIGNGTFDYFIDRPCRECYAGQDRTILAQIVSSMLHLTTPPPVPVRNSSWGQIKSLYR